MLENSKKTFQKEQDELLQTVLNYRFFYPWQESDEDKNLFSLKNDANLEIYLTNECNQNCKYCYLQKYPDLYPSDKLNHDLILKNLEIFYNYLIKNNYSIPKAEFYSGEIWNTNFGLDVLELTINYIKKGLKVGWWMIPSNCSFVDNQIQMLKIQTYIDKFNQLGQPLIFSISIDGKVLEEDSRPRKIGRKEEEFWENIFVFAKHNNFSFHPMISAKFVDKWKENYLWWEQQSKKYGYDDPKIMMLEVRDGDWTDENIASYLDFLEFLLQKYLKEKFKNNIKEMANNLFFIRRVTTNLFSGYHPLGIPQTDTFIGCTCATDLTVRIGDLSIAPCHRLAYNKYLYGKFIVENNEIIGIESNNPQAAIKILMSNFNLASYKCDTCLYNKFCLKGCFGSQYENLGDPFFPVKSVCNLFKKKYSYLLKRYEELGIIDYLYSFNKKEKDYERVKALLNFYEQWKQMEE